MATKAELRRNEWLIKFNAGGEVIVYLEIGNTKEDAAKHFLERVMQDEWHPFDLYDGRGLLMVRTSFIGAIEVYR